MKARYSEQYYRNNWEELIKEIPGKDYINLEKQLQRRMKIYEGIPLPEAELKKVERVEAQRVADTCTALVKEQMQRIKDIEEGRASLGYTTVLQEVQAMGEKIRRFEFNCLQLADFKKAHLNEGR